MIRFIVGLMITIGVIFIALMLYACVVIAKESDEIEYEEEEDESNRFIK